MNQKNPGVYKLKDLRTGKITEQHIENISENVEMARESEIPLEECPEARLPFPELQNADSKELTHSRVLPEGADDDNYVDNSHLLLVPQVTDPNLLEEPPLESPNFNLPSANATLRRSARLASKPLGLAPIGPEQHLLPCIYN